MGSSQNLVFIPALLMAAAVFLSISPSSHGVTHEKLVPICSRTSAPSLCHKILETNPNTLAADLPKLSLISINVTKTQADLNLDAFSKFSQNTSDSALKKAFEHCVVSYHEMQARIQEANQFSQHRLYNNTPLEASKKLAESCARGIIINSLPIYIINKLMIISCETSISVNVFAAQTNS